MLEPVLTAGERLQLQCGIQADALLGSVPQGDVLDALVRADALLGCTDQEHSRLAVSDIARRYLSLRVIAACRSKAGEGWYLLRSVSAESPRPEWPGNAEKKAEPTGANSRNSIRSAI